MLIRGKKRIRNCGKYLTHIADGDTVYIGLQITDEITSRLQEIGFETLNVGEEILPSPTLGPINRFNANGKEVPQKHLPMETAYRQQYWEWEDWNGDHHSRIVDIPYKRYPRKWIPSPEVKLSIVQAKGRKFVIAGEAIIKGVTSDENITHQINIMLEIFRQTEIFLENMRSYEIPKVIPLNWEVLPSGNMPWTQFKKHLTPILAKASTGKKVIITDRLETISKYKPDFHAIGKNGYRGYIIFGFTKLNLYIFESAEYGNATYVFEGDWEKISKMTKAEIINANLYTERFVHLEGWKKQIGELFRKKISKIS